MSKLVTFIFLLVSTAGIAQLSPAYMDYVLRSARENPQLLIEELAEKPPTLENNLLTGELWFYAGNNDNALNIIDQGIQELRERNQSNSLYARTLSNKGLIFWNEGKNDKAKDFLEQALNIQESIAADKESMADTYNNLGLVASSADELSFAKECYNKALKLLNSERITNNEKIAYININIALLEAEEQNYKEALVRLNTLLEKWSDQHTEKLPTEAFILTNLALIYKKTNKLALSTLFLQDAIEIYRDFYGNRNAELANVYSFLAEIKNEEKNFDEALLFIQQALIANNLEYNSTGYSTNPTTDNIIKPTYQLALLTKKASILEDYYFGYSLKKQHLILGLKTLQQADEVIDVIRAKTNNKKDQLALSALASAVYESAQRLSITLNDVTLFDKEYLQSAFYFSEKAKASTLLNAVAESNAKSFANIPQALLEKEKTLKNDIAFITTALSKSDDPSNTKGYKADLFVAERAYEQFVKQLESNYPQYYKLKYSTSPASIKEIQQSLNKNELLLSYFFAEESDQIYCYEIRYDDFKVSQIYGLDEIKRYLNAYRNVLTYQLKQPYQPIALKLRNDLLPKKIHKDVTKIVIIPDAILGVIPFQAMINKATEATDFQTLAYLIKQYAFTYNYAATFHASAMKNSSTGKALLMAPVNFQNPTLNSLPATKEEVMSLEKIFKQNDVSFISYTEQSATESALKASELASYKYLHLATHGSVNSDNPELSAIYLLTEHNKTQELADDGILYISEIYNLSLNAALVSLSACETGLGKISRGEGIIGLGRAFSYAGAQNLLVSLWKVKDASTAELMAKFYEKNLSPEQTNALSLQQTQIEMISNGYADPYLWAPFVIWGK